ncbi:TetR/AcrR family transcriptional regulator [Streptomyces genisteinicus]|uniref:TetR/AcrR family transcriptional regulator n=1 Tax=Streptomyces genisteinicus TaxID=2768068 RepID=A0A7H0HQW8_9ACTN|nr:TetR/AcrR family transcriptional regulator [Streptomyces genisteinicus]QNP62934.1 TetR/AcrR family transcriptional regulator [Streptomyces genisteinicus]
MARSNGAGPGRRASDRGKYGRLSRERVLAAALEIVDREGLTALSMRRLGAGLGVEAMALYRYAPSKDALLDGLVEALYTEVGEALAADGAEPDRTEPDGARAQLRRAAVATYRVALAHPHVVPLLATRILSVPLARRPRAVLREHERVLALLAAAGVPDPAAPAAYRALMSWLLGYLFVDLQAMVDNPDEADPGFRLGLHRIPVQDFPRLRDLAPALAEPGGEAELTAGLDALLDRLLPGAR